MGARALPRRRSRPHGGGVVSLHDDGGPPLRPRAPRTCRRRFRVLGARLQVRARGRPQARRAGPGVSKGAPQERRPPLCPSAHPRQLVVPSVHEPLPAAVSTIRPVTGSPSSVAPPTVPICVPDASPTSEGGASTSIRPLGPVTKLPV